MLDALLVFVPVLGSPILHAPVLKLDLFRGLKRPLDGGATVRGRRLFGDNKTWRGAIVMTSGVIAATALLSLWPLYWNHVPSDVRGAGPWLTGFLVGVGVVVGELPNSFFKRQIGIAPGTQRRSAGGVLISIYDQADFVPAVWVLLIPIYAMSVAQAAIAFGIVAAVHVPINLIGYALGVRETAI